MVLLSLSIRIFGAVSNGIYLASFNSILILTVGKFSFRSTVIKEGGKLNPFCCPIKATLSCGMCILLFADRVPHPAMITIEKVIIVKKLIFLLTIVKQSKTFWNFCKLPCGQFRKSSIDGSRYNEFFDLLL